MLGTRIRGLIAAALILLSAPVEAGLGVQPRPASGGTVDEAISFPFQVAWLSDIHMESWKWDQLRAFVDSMNTAGIDLMVITGDHAEDLFAVSPTDSDTLDAIMGRANFDIQWVLGNHEATPEDTTAQRDPYFTARAHHPIVGGLNYGYVDFKNLRLIVTQNNCNLSINPAAPASYRVNNPFNYTGWAVDDYDGINDPDSPQGQMIDEAMASLNGRIPIILGHRTVYAGSRANAASRWPYITAGQGTGFVRRIEQALPAGRRAAYWGGDQHNVVNTEAIIDSGLSGATEAGIYHSIIVSGGVGTGNRGIDTTDTFQAGTAWLKSYIAHPVGDVTVALARTSVGIADTLTLEGDPDMKYAWYGAVFTVWGDVIVQDTYRVPTEDSETADWYRGYNALILWDSHSLLMDVRGR